jgi:tetratricopeptide (TPR) repeat protein/predicted phosphodiesterase
MPASPKTYTLRVLHLSDLHERVSLDWMSEDRKLKIRLGRAKRHRVLGPALEERLKAIAKERPPDLLVFTGDLADFGLDEEYVAAKAQLIGVLKLLGLGWDRVFLVPGNHDIKRKEEPTCWSEMRRFAEDHHNRGRLNDWLAGTSPPPGAPTNGLDLPAKRQSGYRAFVQNIERPELLPDGSRGHPRLGYRQTLALPGLPPIHIIGLDTAWLAGDDNDSTRLLLTEHQVVLNATNHDDGKPLPGLRLALMHHPLSDLGDAADARRLLSDHVDIVLHGHQHTAEAVDTANPDRGLRTLAAGSLYEGDEGDKWINSFHVIDVVMNAEGRPLRYDVQFYAWAPASGHWHKDSALYKNAPEGRLVWETPLGQMQSPTVTAAPIPAAALAKFVGRAEQLADLAAALLPPSGQAQAAVVCNLQGMAGVGKSFLVERFVKLYGDRFIGGYKKITLGEAEQPTAESLLQSIAERLGLKPSPDDLLARVQMALEHRPHLLHIDNLDTSAQAQAAAELVERLPSTPLILTGRHTFADAGGWLVVPVAPFAVDEALQQLNQELGDARAMAEPEADKRALVTELGGLPLAISLAGSYLHGGRSIRTFLERYRQKLLDIEPYHPNSKSYQDSTRKALRSLAAAFNLSIDALRERLGADADAGLPALCALGVAPLVGARIGWTAAIMGVGETQAEDWLDKALTLSIVQHDPETRRWRVHKLLGEHLRSLTDAGTAIARMDQWVAERLVNEPMQSRGARWESLYTELEGVIEWVTGLNGARVIGGAIVGLEYALAKGPYDVWLSAAQRGLCETTDARLKVKLLGGVGRLAKGAGNYELALQCSEKWTAYANAYGWDEEIAQARRFGAGVLHMTGQLEDVLRILRDEVLPVLDKLSHERETADLRLEIADVLIARRRLNEAQDICDHDVMPVYVRLDDKRRSANLMSRIASIHHARGQYSQALQIRMYEVLPVYQERSDNLETAKTLGWMALEFQHLGEHGKALTILTDSVVPTFSQLGDLNGKCVAQGQIADVYYLMGEHTSALQILTEEILPICKRLGDIRGVAITMGKIARIQKSNGAFIDALRTLREETMPIFKRLRDDHSRAMTMTDIAEVFIARGELNRALCIETKLVSVYTKLAAHSETIYTLGKISDIYQARMQYNEAIRWRREAVQITRTLGNPRHTIVQEGKLAISLLLTRKLKHRDEARSLLTTALKSAEDLDFPNEAKQIRSVFPRFNLRLPT